MDSTVFQYQLHNNNNNNLHHIHNSSVTSSMSGTIWLSAADRIASTDGVTSTADLDDVGGHRLVDGPRWRFLPLAVVPAWILVGNCLVLLAVLRQRSLRTLSNWVIASLAFADFLLALLVVPLGVYQLVAGSWQLGLFLCLAWTGSDVILSTTSIMHLCAIALYRYNGIANPLRVRSTQDARHVAALVIPAWTAAIALSVPFAVQGATNTSHVLTTQEVLVDGGLDGAGGSVEVGAVLGGTAAAVVVHSCGIFDRTFAVYSSLVSFFIPLAIMIFADARSIQILRRNVRFTTVVSSGGGAGPRPAGASGGTWPRWHRGGRQRRSRQKILHANGGTGGGGVADDAMELNSTCSVPIVVESTVDGLMSSPGRRLLQSSSPDRLRSHTMAGGECHMGSSLHPPLSSRSSQQSGHDASAAGSTDFIGSASASPGRHSRLDSDDDDDDDSAVAFCGGGGSGTPSNSTPLHRLDRSFHQLQTQPPSASSSNNSAAAHPRGTISTNTTSTTYVASGTNSRTSSGCMRAKSVVYINMLASGASTSAGMFSGGVCGPIKVNSRERRAERTLIWVFVTFVVLWMPFFCANLTYGLCRTCDVPGDVFLAFTWLGYLSSGVNPCIYTYLNPDFRNAFRNIITCRRLVGRTPRLPRQYS